MANAFAGADAAYLMIPPNIGAPDVRAWQQRVVNALIAAVEKNKPKHVVALSSIGADKPAGTGPVVALHNLESGLATIDGVAVLSLRAAYFMENILPQVGVIRMMAMMLGPLRVDLRLPMIASRDIGAVAAETLRKRDFSGKQTRELLGQRDVSYGEVARAVGAAIGKPDLSYQQAPAAQLKSAMTQMGMSESMADLLLDMSDALNSGHMKSLEPRTAANTMPTSLEDFAREVFAPAFQAKASGA